MYRTRSDIEQERRHVAELNAQKHLQQVLHSNRPSYESDVELD